MNNQPKIHEQARKAEKHYSLACDYIREYNSDIPKAIAYYYCGQIVSAMVKNKKNWEDVLCEDDIKYLYENGTPNQIKIMSRCIDAYSDGE